MTGGSFLDVPPFPDEGYAKLADRLARLIGTRHDIVFVQAEAIVALEAAATSLARPGMAAINVVTSAYGRWFGDWLRRAGASVVDVTAAPGKAIDADAVATAMARTGRVDLVAVVHAESASGILNPLPAILDLARKHGALTVVDAVASVGGHPIDFDAIDVAVFGPQKGLGGSSGISVATVSPQAWKRIAAPGGPTQSVLSLLDLKRGWLDTGRGALPGMPSALEFHAFDAALARDEAEGLAAIIARHARAGGATRDAIQALGLPLWTPDDAASNLVTAAVVPGGIDADALLAAAAPFGAGLQAGVGEAGHRFVRMNHTGPRAQRAVVEANIAAYSEALAALGHRTDRAAAGAAIAARYAR